MALKQVVGELIYKITGDSKGLGASLAKSDAAVKKLEKSMKNGSKTVSGLKSEFNALKAGVVGFFAAVGARALFGLAQAGAQLDSLTQSFTRLTSEMGISGDEVLDTLRKTSAGTVANSDLIQSANRAMVLGVANSVDEFSTLMQIARIRAADMGTDTTQAFNDIVTGIGRSSPLILDNLGIVIKQNEAYEKYAASLGKTTDALTDNEKREALKFAVLEQGRKQIEQVGEVTVSYAERLQQASAFVKNLKENIGRALLPAMASLLDATLKNNSGFLQSREQVNELGKNFYRIGQGILVVARIVKTFGQTMKIVAQAVVASVANTAEAVLKTGDAIGEFFGLSSDGLKKAISDVEAFKNAVLDDSKETYEAMLDNNEKLQESLSEAFDPKSYQGLSDGQFASLISGGSDSVGGAIGDAGDAAEEAAKQLEDFQNKMLDTVDTAQKAQQELGEKLAQSFTTFGENIKKNADETVQGLAEIAIGAEKRIAELKKERKDTDDADRRKAISKEIKEQEAILKARKEFEERETARVTALREKLEAAGIDAAQAGVDGLLEVRDLESEIQEQRRVASLDEFTRFEEQQVAKREALVAAFIEEVNLLNNKIEKQKELENEVTAFLLSQNVVREAAVKAFADQAIAKYGEMAASLRSAISLQQRLNSLRSNPRQFHDGGYVGADGGEVHAGEYVIPANMVSRMGGLVSALESQRRGNVTNNTRNISAPVNVNATIGGQADISTIGREFAWQLTRSI